MLFALMFFDVLHMMFHVDIHLITIAYSGEHRLVTPLHLNSLVHHHVCFG